MGEILGEILEKIAGEILKETLGEVLKEIMGQKVMRNPAYYTCGSSRCEPLPVVRKNKFPFIRK